MKNIIFSKLTPKVVLGVAAHPDDLEYGGGGTLAKFAAAGAEVHYLILTDGSRGSSDLKMSPAKLAEIRQKEQRAALKAIGGSSVQFLDYLDGCLEITMDLKKAIVRAIRELKPEVVVTMDPSMIYVAEQGFVNHPDHRAAGQATLDAVFPLARDHLSFPELFKAGLKPHEVATVLLINLEKSNFYVDITDSIDQKMAALAAHASQKMRAAQKMLRQLASEAGKAADCRYAEPFVRIDVKA
ncbi:MAG TPA: PIG-L deacetylase family protein [Candidatus Saccharimonadales bacterium]|nr:PIG-L deacetylase family protein [Candidatus Saccharimonadales bacterium]